MFHARIAANIVADVLDQVEVAGLKAYHLCSTTQLRAQDAVRAVIGRLSVAAAPADNRPAPVGTAS